jgi:ATP-dependent Clp protease ATP-binding subunit ClpA
MADRFDKFTERARRVLTLAQTEAQEFNHNYIGTEHLLLGLVREGDGVAAKVLANCGVRLDSVREAVEVIIGRGDRPIMGEIGLTPRAKKVIELAVDEARRLNHHYIGTEHLLLGLVREGEGIAAGALESLGVSLERVRAETTRTLAQSMPAARPRSASRWRRVKQAIQRRFSDDQIRVAAGDARPIVERARVEAMRFDHNYLGTEHLLLALARDRESGAAMVLENFGVEVNKVVSAVEFIIGRGDRVVLGDIGLTPRADKCLKLAVGEMERMEHAELRSEHILLGLLREGEGIAAGVLESLGVNLERARPVVQRALTPPVGPEDDDTDAVQ